MKQTISTLRGVREQVESLQFSHQLAFFRSKTFHIYHFCTVPMKGHGIMIYFWTGDSPLWTGDSPLSTGDRHFQLAIHHSPLRMGIATVQKDCRLITFNMASIVSMMLVSLSVICCCLPSCKAVLHSYIPAVQQNIGQNQDGLISTYFHLGFSHVEILSFLIFESWNTFKPSSVKKNTEKSRFTVAIFCGLKPVSLTMTPAL